MTENSVSAATALPLLKRTPVLFGTVLVVLTTVGGISAAAGPSDTVAVRDGGEKTGHSAAEVIYQIRTNSSRIAAGGNDGGAIVPVDVFVDSRDVPLAAWQVELRGVSPDLKILDVVGGDASVWQAMPYFDPAGLNSGRIILAAFTTADHPPSGTQRVARVQVSVADSSVPEIAVRLHAAASVDGRPVPAAVSLQAAGR